MIILNRTCSERGESMIYSFYHLTDLHYYSKRNFACDPWSLPQPDGQISFRESEEINKKAFEIILNDSETKTVIITGDLTDNGDKFSHEEMSALLSNFTEKGGRPFVFTDSHDYPWFDIFKYDENGNKIPNEHLPEDEVIPMYYPFGRDKAIAVYDGDKNSYVAELFPKLRYIAMGYDYTSEDKLHDPKFSNSLMRWVTEQIRLAKKDGAAVICGTHWPVVLPSPVYGILAKGNTFVNGEECLRILADEDVGLFFSGHSHIQRIREVMSDIGNKIYSVSTSALVGFPPKMRKITIDTDKRTAEIRTINMEVPELNLDMSLTDYTRKGFLGSLEQIPYNMEHDVEAFAETGGGVTLPKDIILKHPKIVMFLGKKLNGLTYGKAAKFSSKYHNMEKEEYSNIAENKVVPFIFDIVAGLYQGNQSYSPDTAEYKIAMAVAKKLDDIASKLKINIPKILGGYSLSQMLKPLLYNSGIDDDNADICF